MPMNHAPFEIDRGINLRVRRPSIFRLHMEQAAAHANVRIKSSAQNLTPHAPEAKKPRPENSRPHPQIILRSPFDRYAPAPLL
jgi:hypothetical protein